MLPTLPPDDVGEDGEAPAARATLRQRLAEAVEANPELTAPELADLFARTLPDADRPLVEQFLAAEARNILAWELRAQFSRVRRGIFAALDLTNKEAVEPMSEPAVAARETLYERIAQWREYEPQSGRTRLLLDMTKAELLSSAQYDAGRIAAFGWKMLVKERLAQRMGDGERVADRYSAEEVAGLISRTRQEMTRGNFRLRIQPVAPLPRPTVRKRKEPT